jgi:hypothetical protein
MWSNHFAAASVMGLQLAAPGPLRVCDDASEICESVTPVALPLPLPPVPWPSDPPASPLEVQAETANSTVAPSAATRPNARADVRWFQRCGSFAM